MPFISFKGISQVYLLKISITHNKKQIPLLNLLINCVSAKSKFRLCNSSANSLFDIFPFLIPLPEVDLSASEVHFLSKEL